MLNMGIGLVKRSQYINYMWNMNYLCILKGKLR